MRLLRYGRIEVMERDMLQECHAHIFMDGVDYQRAARKYRSGVDGEDIRNKLRTYQEAGIDYVRDGGDHYDACRLAARLSPEYGIEYRTPIFAIHRKGQYGGIVGHSYEDMKGYHQLVLQVKALGGDFIKVMLSGIMDFEAGGAVTGTGREAGEIHELIHIAHEEGFAVMAHVNGDREIRQAIEAGVDTVEHGNFMEEETLHALAESQAVWVPTIATLGNLIGAGRFDDTVINRLFRMQLERVHRAWELGALVASGSDAGAYRVRHVQGLLDEWGYLYQAGTDISDIEGRVALANAQIRRCFRTR